MVRTRAKPLAKLARYWTVLCVTLVTFVLNITEDIRDWMTYDHTNGCRSAYTEMLHLPLHLYHPSVNVDVQRSHGWECKIWHIILREVKSDSYLAAGMCSPCALVVIVFMARDLGVISNSKLRARIQPYSGTFFETSVFTPEFAWRTTQMDVDGTSGWQSWSDRMI